MSKNKFRSSFQVRCQHPSVCCCKLRPIYQQSIARSIPSLRCSRNSHFIDIPYPKIFKIQLIHLFRQNQSKYSLDEQIVCKNTFILMYDILFQQCWINVDQYVNESFGCFISIEYRENFKQPLQLLFGLWNAY